ncbi:hypothetical protein BGZ57DRAFT_850779 [Hyaloscypha finlandica]|nr:hypothetical protein BGZ57DRAFT_850779 [Hyaloscypha finlandica]
MDNFADDQSWTDMVNIGEFGSTPDPTSSETVPARNALAINLSDHDEIQHQPLLLIHPSFNSTETSLVNISSNPYDGNHTSGDGYTFDEIAGGPFYGSGAIEVQGSWNEHQNNQHEQHLETYTGTQEDIYTGSITSNKARPRCDECGQSFCRNPELKRHQKYLHKNGGYICGDCGNDGSNDEKLLRKDHFQVHLREKHGFHGPANLYLTCQFESCQRENPHQKVYFTTQGSLKVHEQIKHGGVSVSQHSGSVSKEQSPPSTDPTGNSGHIANRKRISQETRAPIQGVKRIRSSIGYGTPESGTEEGSTFYIENVSAYEFIRAKSRWNKISKFVNSECWVPGIPFISYDTSRRSIRLCVRTSFVGDVKASVTRHLEDTRCSKDPVMLRDLPENRLTAGDQHHSNSHPPPTTSTKASDSVKVFPIRKKEDSLAVNLWNKSILPALPKILDEPMKTGYTACLVRKGTSFESATPIIRIESHELPGESTKENILALLNKACVPSLPSVKIRVQFCKGSIIHLSGVIEEDEETCGENEDRPLALHNSYWEHAGMGASIGLLCTNTEFATLGCYLNVDGGRFILTVDHFIQKSYESLDQYREGDRKTLTSPAIAKVRSMGTRLEQLFSKLDTELQAKVDKNPELNLEDMEDPANLPTLNLVATMEQVQILLKQHQKKEIEYKIGSLSYQCNPRSVALLSGYHSTVKQAPQSSDGTEHGVRLDWAVFEVDSASSRKGRNRYRRNRDSGDTTLSPNQEELGEGQGEICRQTCIVEGNEKVHFVGGRNGSLEGQVNGTLQLVHHDNLKTLEHHIVMCPDHERSATEHAGASGTMVVKVPGHEILGMVWGCNQDSGQPLFTPIHTIFEDIGKVIGAENVKLEEYPEPEASNVLLVSGSERDAPPLAPLRASDIPHLPLSSDKKLELSKIISAKIALRSKDRSVSDTPSETTTIQDQSQTQAPSLSSSRASSPGSLPPTPVLKSIEIRSTSDCARDRISIFGEDTGPSLILDERGEDSIQEDTLQMQLGNDAAIENRLSIPFLLGSEPQKSLLHMFSPTLSGRWNTWPIETGRSWNASAEKPGQLEVMAR